MTIRYRFNMEVHLVHESDDGRTAVIGIMYKIGRPDTFISMVNTSHIRLIITTPTNILTYFNFQISVEIKVSSIE